MTAMTWMVEQLMIDPNTINKKITRAEYLDWARGFVFEAMRDQRYGQSFCNHFDITDNILYYSSNVADADVYIQENYVR